MELTKNEVRLTEKVTGTGEASPRNKKGGVSVPFDLTENDRLLFELVLKKIDDVGATVSRGFEINDERHSELFRGINQLRIQVSENAKHSHPHCEACGTVSKELATLDKHIEDKFKVRDRAFKIALAISLASGALSHFIPW